MLEDLIFNRLMTPFWTAWHSQVLGLDLRCSVDWPGLGSYKLAAGEDALTRRFLLKYFAQTGLVRSAFGFFLTGRKGSPKRD